MTRESQIAVVGMACRLPGGADDPESLWSMLAEGRDGRREVPQDRWDWKSFYHKHPETKEATNFSHAYFLDHDLSAFDARFFGVPGAEATGIDPQHRFLLEITYEALENAGIPIETLRGSNSSVHMAMFARDYDRMGYKDGPQLHKTHIIGSGDAILANRISYLFDLKGPSNTLDTGCSGSLVALHQACRTLRENESTLALAGASQLLLTPDQSIVMSQLTNKDGQCYTFDDRGAGYARGEGLGVLVLKRLDRALADGDKVHAIVVDSGCNHDGKTAGIFLPNPDAQEALARSVYTQAGLDPRETLYVEAHGTGTQAGDGAEISSIGKVFGREAGRESDLPVGSIKANIGHLEAASGIASMIKAIMVLKKDQIPPQLNFINPKPSLLLEKRGIKVPLKTTSLTPQGHVGPRRVSVNSFGYGGTNAHAILEAYDHASLINGHSIGMTNGNTGGYASITNGHSIGMTNGNSGDYASLTNGHSIGITNENTGDYTPLTNGHSIDMTNGNTADRDVEPRLVVLSANSELSLSSLISKLRQWLGSDQGHSTSFTDLIYTLNLRRSKLPWRCSIVASNYQELGQALADSKLRPIKSAMEIGMAFVFTGQGAQWFAMGRELLSSSLEFANSLAFCNQAIKDLGCNWDLVEELSRDKETSRLDDSRFSQPSTTAVQIALVDLLESYGIRPEAVYGHSSGEIAAAYTAGALSREAAMHVAYNRGICSSKAKDLNATKGAMLAVGEGEEAIQKRINVLGSKNGKVTVACVNSPKSTTISGDLSAIQKLQAVLDAASVFNRRLKVDSAYHSHHMEVVASSYRSSLDNLIHGTPRKDVAFYSTVTGTRKLSEFGPSYWVSNLVSQVKFSAASQLMAEHLSAANSTANNVVVEVGPHSALSGPLRQSLSNFKSTSGASFKYTYIPCLVRNDSALGTILVLAGKVFEAGCSVQVDAVMSMDGGNASASSRRQVVDNLPTYPWDHSSTYWHESRISKGYRLRPFPFHDLLGLFDVHSSPQEPRWRYHVSLESVPWLRDHVVEGFVIFPGVGYVIMVVEAMKQLFQLRKLPGRVRNINFRNVNFAKPVVVHDDGAKGSREVEMQLVLSPSRQYAESPWEYFRVISYDSQNDSWIENCTGLTSYDSVAIETQTQVDEVEGTRDDGLGHLTKAAADRMLQDIQASCPTPVDTAEFYRNIAASGIQYGPTFQGLKEIHVGKNYGLARIVIGDVVQQMPGQYMQPHTIHPTAFDSIIQLEAVVIRRECTTAPMIPVMCGEISIAADMDNAAGSEIIVALHLFPESRREATCKFCAYQKQSDGTFRPVITGSEIRPQAIGDADSDNSFDQKTSYRMEWKPDADHIKQDDFMDHLARHNLFDIGDGTMSKHPPEEQLHFNDTVASIFIRRAVQRMREESISTACTPHLTKLLNWMRKWDESEAGRYLDGVTLEDEAQLIEQASDANIVGLALSRLGPQYPALFTGKADALELLVQDDLLGRLYSEFTLFMYHYAQIGEYMEALVHKNPNMKILEIGAGTGGATMPLMEKIQRNDRLLLDHYTYTDISSGFFERARSKFHMWTGQIDFKTLDVSRDPLEQGFTAHNFNVIVASIVLHATPLMDVTMANVRKLLKPGGRLVLMELTAVSAASNGVFGTLEGWWMSQDGRQDGPLLTRSDWDSLLKRHGFSGLDLAIPAFKGQGSDGSTVIVTQAISTPDADDRQDVRGSGSVMEMAASVHLGYSDDAHQVVLGDAICHALGKTGVKCSQRDWSMDPTADADGLAIIVDSAEHPLLLEPAHETLGQIKQILLQRKNIFWVSFQHSSPSDGTAALKNMVNGLARVVRREEPNLRLITVDIQDQIQLSGSAKLEHIVQTLTKIAMSSFWPVLEAVRAEEREYAILDGNLIIPRVIPDDYFANFIESRNPSQDQGATSLVECKYLDKDRRLMFDVQVPGLLNTIRFVDNDKMTGPLGPEEIEVQAHAHGVNFKDVFVALGQMAPGTGMTGEVAGVVTAVGSNVQSLWKPGDRVIGLMVAPFGNQVRINSNGAVAIPDSVTFADAASMAIVYYTAWYCLTHVARLEKGQSVLIHAASGGVGQAAIQLAKHVGAEIFVTVGSVAKRKLIQDQYSINESHIFSSHSGQFKKHIMNFTQGRGVDVVLNSLSGQLLMDSWDCVAQFGTFLEIGKTDIYRSSLLNMANFEKQATFAAVDVSHMYRLRPGYVTRGLREIFAMADKGLLKPVHPVTTCPMTRIEETFRLIAARKHVGKLVLVADEQTVVQATRPKATPLRLHREGTYVIGGGLGDLGKKMGLFLAEKGAGHIVALTRRNVDAQQRAPLEEATRKLGGTLHIFKCDIGDEKSVRAAAEEIASLPPVRGVIQSALVLSDHPLEYMELEHWMTAVKPKVQGTLNMRKAFCSPKTTDFFIMLSSVASMIGSNSQSNYAAGNAFQDAFAHAQTRGTRGITNFTSISVGAVEGSEQIARALDQNSEIVRIIGSVSFDDVLATLEYAMGPQARLDEAMHCIMPFDRDRLEDAKGPEALSDHMLDHIPSKRRQGEKSSNSATDTKKPDVAQAVEQAESIADAENIVKQALLDKFAAFTGDDVPDDQPIVSIGLDSLVSIELKNWIQHTFQIPLQTSELNGTRSVAALAKLLVSRMDLGGKVQASGSANDNDKREGTFDSQIQPQPEHMNGVNGHENDGNVKPRHGWDCCKRNDELLAQPLPDLDDSLNYWLEANEHLFSPQQLESIQQDIQAIRAPNSPARQILQDLYKKHEHDKSHGWFTDVVTNARFLCSREPIAPYGSIMAGHRDSKRHQSQAERATIITSSTLSFKRAMDAGKIQPLEIAGKPECTFRWGWLFNSTRVPRLKCDKMVSYASDDQSARDHIVVSRKGHLFKLMLQDRDGKDVPFQQLQAAFEAIVAQVEDDGMWSGMLTTDERDSWAQTREKLSALSPANAEYFHVIDSAMFVLCLDAGNPKTPEDIARQGFIGDGSNRWFDKVLQFYVSANGRSGQITEHGMIDGTTPARLLEWIVTAMDQYSPSSVTAHDQLNGDLSPRIELEEVVLQTTPEIESHIKVLRERFHNNTLTATYVREQLDEFGTDFLLQSRVSVKGVIDLTFQLALRLFFGRNVPSWEPMSAAHFHTGRADALQRAAPAVNAFCDAAAEVYQRQDQSSGTKARLAALLSPATKQMHAGMQTMLDGRSFTRIFEVLSYLWPSNASTPKPRFLDELIFFGRPNPPVFAQSNAIEMESYAIDVVHLFMDPDGFWSFLVPEKNEIRVCITGGSQEQTAAFVKNLHLAARIMRDIVKAA